MQDFRASAGGLIDRTRPVEFTFDGQTFQGYAGDTLASALLANGVRLVGRSFKYHRPRGILSAGPEEPNALVELRQGAAREPNTRATVVEIFPGLAARSQNRFPSLKLDLMSITGLLGPVFAAGFYYKTFMWPAAFWERVYEPLIRRAAGLGRASGLPDPDSYDKQNAFADVLVIGAGPAGLAAALAASGSGARVILAEQDFALGGRLLSDRHDIDGQPAAIWLAETEAKLRAAPNVRILTRTTITGIYDGGTYAGIERVSDHMPTSHGAPRQRLWRIVAPRAVLATGAIERPLVFGGNDLPGVMLAGAVRSYLNRFAVKPGARAVVFANNDDGAGTIADLAAAGITVAALVDSRAAAPPALRDLAASLNIPIYANATIRQTTGGSALKGVILGGAATGTTLQCDLLAVSGGWNPALHLASHHGGKPAWDEAIAAFVPGPMPPGLCAAGAAAGHFRLSEALATGHASVSDSAAPAPTTSEDSAAITPLWQIPDSLGKSFVDFQNDVTAADIALAAREGFTAVEHLKRYTTLGMATDQGKTSNVTGLALMAALTSRTIGQTGTTVFRPPYTPVAIGAMAGAHRGQHFRPTRRTPAHAWAEQQGAQFVEAGEWLRATHFPRAGESLQHSVDREVRSVRQSAGFSDVSTLGKIDVQGPDAAAFLDFIYANMISTLAVGRVRYALMLREDGFAFDDGTVARLAPAHFLLTTTTANAARVLRHFDICHKLLKPDLDVCIEPVTDQWAQFALAGPRARLVLEKLVGESTDVSTAGLPFMGTTASILCGAVPARLFRISFSGELAYELAVPASQGARLADALLDAGAEPYGLEALNVLRLEKGHPVGAELNGQTTAADLGLGAMLSKKKDFIGRALAQRPALLDPLRPALVGLRPRTPGATLHAGAHLIPLGAPATAANDQGHVTSAAYSATLGQWIALALVAGGDRRAGEMFRAVNPLQGTEAEVEVVSRVFHDPEGRLLHA
jgi:sarcosine oxidase subunit alpha